jgi:hypothetical protein
MIIESVIDKEFSYYVLGDEGLLSVPKTEGNRHYQEIQEWIASGGIVEEYVEPKIVPQTVTKAQGKAALIQAGYWQAVLDFVETIPDPTQKLMAQVALNDTTEWKRTSPFLMSAAEEIELTEAQLDQLFITASGIEL